jgi:hypothetical protein
MRNLAESKTSRTDVELNMNDEETPMPGDSGRRWRQAGLVTTVGSVVAVGAVVVVAAAAVSRESGLEDDSSGTASTNQYYTAAEVTAACDELVGAKGEGGSETPDVTVCVGRGSDPQHIDGLSVAIAPDAYASLSGEERAAVATAFIDHTGMPVSLKAGQSPHPT